MLTPRARRSPAYRAVLGAFVALGASAGTWGARIPDIRDDLDLREGTLGTAVLGLSIGAVAGAWIGGLLVRRCGSRLVVAWSWRAVGVLLVLPGLAGTWAGLMAGLLAMGLAIGVLDVSMNGAGVQLEATATRPLLSGLHAGWSGGVLLGAAIGSGAVAVGLSLTIHFALAGSALVATGALLGGSVPDGRIATGSAQARATAPRAPPGGRPARSPPWPPSPGYCSWPRAPCSTGRACWSARTTTEARSSRPSPSPACRPVGSWAAWWASG